MYLYIRQSRQIGAGMKRKITLICSIAFLILAAWIGIPIEKMEFFQPASGNYTDSLQAEPDDLQVHFIDVGQGDATLILCDGRAMLIDAGDNKHGTAVQNYLTKQGVESLDYLVLTHPDEDHIGGGDVVISKFEVGTLIMPSYEKNTVTFRDVEAAMKYSRLKSTEPEPGDTYSLGNAEFTIIAPVTTEYGEETNNYSVGLRLVLGETSFLFTGDAEKEAEEDILNNGMVLRADVYKAGHHGSNSSSGKAFVGEVDPAYAVISCGEGNSYGHPRAETLDLFRSSGIEVFRTDEQGSIIAVSDGSVISWNCAPTESWIPGEPMGGNPVKPEYGDGKAYSYEGAQTADESIDKGNYSTETEAGSVEITYVLNTSSMKFHKPDCSRLPTANREDSSLSREEVLSQGYAPCKICSP